MTVQSLSCPCERNCPELCAEHTCRKPMRGPLGSVVGRCELPIEHDGPCIINGVSEQDMVDTLSTESRND